MLRELRLLAVILIFLLPGIYAQQSIGQLLEKYNTGDIPYISAEELRMHQLNENLIILDAREEVEFEVSHIKQAVFVGYDKFAISQVKDYPREQRVVIYCSVGIRSERIAKKLQNAGFTNVQNLYGGIFSWKKKGFAVVDSNGKQTEKVHAYSKHWSKWLKNAEKVY